MCDTKDVELVRSLGARDVLDRLHEDFTKNGETYDVIFDAVGKHSFRRCRRSLKPGGIYISLDLGFMYHVPLLALVTRFVGSKRATLGIGRYRKDDLVLVKELVEAGKYRPVIDRTYALDEVVEAYAYVETGQKTGNVVLRVARARARRAARAGRARGSAGVAVGAGLSRPPPRRSTAALTRARSGRCPREPSRSSPRLRAGRPAPPGPRC